MAEVRISSPAGVIPLSPSLTLSDVTSKSCFVWVKFQPPKAKFTPQRPNLVAGHNDYGTSLSLSTKFAIIFYFSLSRDLRMI